MNVHTTFRDVLAYSEQLGGSNGHNISSLTAKVAYFRDYAADARANGFNPETSPTIQDKLWRYISRIRPEWSTQRAEDIIVDDAVVKPLFSPLIGDSPLIKSAPSSAPLKMMRAILLVAEVAGRELLSTSISLSLKLYALRDDDRATFLQMNLNRHHPLYTLRDDLMAFFGGY